MEILFADGLYRVSGDARRYKTLRGARDRARALAKATTCPKPAAGCRTDVEAMAQAARPLPDNVVALTPRYGTPAVLAPGHSADVLRLEFFHRGYTAAWNVSQDRPVAGPALVQEWKNAGSRAAWKRENGPKRVKTDKERVRDNQKNDGRLK